MTRDELEAIRARDQEYNDIFEQQATMSRDIAHRLVAWPVHDRRALLALLTDLAAAAGKVTCFYCGPTGRTFDPCPDCADLRRLMEVLR